MPAPRGSASFGSSKIIISTTRLVGDTRGSQNTGVTKKSASGGGRVKKAGRVLIFFTHFPLETPFLKAAVRPRSLRLSPRLTAEARSLPHCWRWPPFTDPQPRECVHIICYFGLHFTRTGGGRRKKKKKQLFSSNCASVWGTSERQRATATRFMQTSRSCKCTSLNGDGVHGVLSDAPLHRSHKDWPYTTHIRVDPLLKY